MHKMEKLEPTLPQKHPDLGGQARGLQPTCHRMHTMENLQPTLPEEHPDLCGQARGLEPTCHTMEKLEPNRYIQT